VAVKAWWVAVLALGCAFKPDLSRYQSCDAGDTCPAGYQCLASEQVCLPSCGDPPLCGADGGLAIGPEALPPAVETRPYQVQLEVDGGAGPYSFRSMALPPDLRVEDGGLISGVPSDAGVYLVAIEVEDQPALRATYARTLGVRALLRVAGPRALANAAAGQVYVERLSATGGDGGYRFAVADGGTLPPGLTLAMNGALTGTTPDAGGSSFDVEVMDGDQPPQRAIQRVTMNVVVLPLALQFATQGLPDGRLGTPYSYGLQRFAGTGFSTWTLTAGALPQNVGLDTATGVLSGTPSTRGKSTFTVQLRDSLTSVEATFSIDVY
jgi:hypothetical protein